MRVRGYALSELLVAIAVTGLIVSVLTFLNVDYVSLARRVTDIGAPYVIGTTAEAQLGQDRCASPGAILSAGDNEIDAVGPRAGQTPELTLASEQKVNRLSTALGFAGASSQPIRLVVGSAAASGRSVASIEVGDATVGVVAPRCDLREVCDFDAANTMCREDEGNAVVQPG
jgi:hypothetical protein